MWFCFEVISCGRLATLGTRVWELRFHLCCVPFSAKSSRNGSVEPRPRTMIRAGNADATRVERRCVLSIFEHISNIFKSLRVCFAPKRLLQEWQWLFVAPTGRGPSAGCEVPVPLRLTMVGGCSAVDSRNLKVPSNVSACQPCGRSLQGLDDWKPTVSDLS